MSANVWSSLQHNEWSVTWTQWFKLYLQPAFRVHDQIVSLWAIMPGIYFTSKTSRYLCLPCSSFLQISPHSDLPVLVHCDALTHGIRSAHQKAIALVHCSFSWRIHLEWVISQLLQDVFLDWYCWWVQLQRRNHRLIQWENKILQLPMPITIVSINKWQFDHGSSWETCQVQEWSSDWDGYN